MGQAKRRKERGEYPTPGTLSDYQRQVIGSGLVDDKLRPVAERWLPAIQE